MCAALLLATYRLKIWSLQPWHPLCDSKVQVARLLTSSCASTLQVKTSPVPQKDGYFATLKSTNYLVNALAVLDAQVEGFDQVWHDRL